MSKSITGIDEEVHKRFRHYIIHSEHKNASDALTSLLNQVNFPLTTNKKEKIIA